MVGYVGSLYGQARRVLVRRAPVSWGRFDPVRVARIGVAGLVCFGIVRHVFVGVGELWPGEAGLAGKAGFVDFGLGAVR